MDIYNTAIEFFQTGGAFMYPILFAFTIGLAIALERYIKLTLVHRVNNRTWSNIKPVISSGDFDKARNIISDDDTEISNVLRMGLERQGAVQRRSANSMRL